MTVLTIFNWRVESLTLFYYCAHIFGLLCALAIVTAAVTKHMTEEKSVGDFEFNITDPISKMFYISSAFLLITVTTGYFAQRYPDKSSLWIVYCILLAIVSVLLLTASISAFTKAHAKNLTLAQMKYSMEKYSDTDKNSNWAILQKKYNCCGALSYRDWQDVRYGRTSLRVPPSCCLPERRSDKNCGLNILPFSADADKKIYPEGCHKPALEGVRRMLRIMNILGFFVAATHTILTFLSCYLVVFKKV